MNRLVTLSIAALAMTAAALPASAADLGRPITKAPPIAPVPVVNWTGFYVGVGLGGRWTNTDFTNTCLAPDVTGVCIQPSTFDNPSSFDMSGFRASGYVGYNWQIGTWVLGIEGDFGWADNTQVHLGIPGTLAFAVPGITDTAEVRDRWDASLRGRVGFLVTPQFLLYATGGVSWLDKEVTITCDAGAFSVCLVPHSESVSKTMVGWTVGGGIDWMFAPSWVVRAEYRYADYTGDSLTNRFFAITPVDAFDVAVDQKTHTLTVGLSYLFNWGAPVAARY